MWLVLAQRKLEILFEVGVCGLKIPTHALESLVQLDTRYFYDFGLAIPRNPFDSACKRTLTLQ